METKHLPHRVVMKTDEIILEKCLAHNKYSVYVIWYHYDFCQRKTEAKTIRKEKKFYLKRNTRKSSLKMTSQPNANHSI